MENNFKVDNLAAEDYLTLTPAWGTASNPIDQIEGNLKQQFENSMRDLEDQIFAMPKKDLPLYINSEKRLIREVVKRRLENGE